MSIMTDLFIAAGTEVATDAKVPRARPPLPRSIRFVDFAMTAFPVHHWELLLLV